MWLMEDSCPGKRKQKFKAVSCLLSSWRAWNSCFSDKNSYVKSSNSRSRSVLSSMVVSSHMWLVDAKRKHRYRTFPSSCEIPSDSVSLDHCISLPEHIERGWSVALSEDLFPFPGNSTICYPLSSYGIPCTDMDILTTWLEVRLPTLLCVLKFCGLDGLDSMCSTATLRVFHCLSHRKGQHDGREVVALDSALAPSYSPNMTTGKLHHLSEFLCPCLITIACKILKLLYVKHLAHGLDKQTR